MTSSLARGRVSWSGARPIIKRQLWWAAFERALLVYIWPIQGMATCLQGLRPLGPRLRATPARRKPSVSRTSLSSLVARMLGNTILARKRDCSRRLQVKCVTSGSLAVYGRPAPRMASLAATTGAVSRSRPSDSNSRLRERQSERTTPHTAVCLMPEYASHPDT